MLGVMNDRELDAGARTIGFGPTRRQLLGGWQRVDSRLPGGSLLAACGGSSSSSAPSATSAATSTASDPFAANAGTPPGPAHGGTLRIGMTGNGTSETYDSYQVSTPIDGLHVSSVFDPMIRPAPYAERAGARSTMDADQGCDGVGARAEERGHVARQEAAECGRRDLLAAADRWSNLAGQLRG